MLLEKYSKKAEEILNEIKQMEAEIQTAHQVRSLALFSFDISLHNPHY